MTLSPAATKFINVIEAMVLWPINTTVVEIAGKSLSLKMARELVQELKTSTAILPPSAIPGSIPALAVAAPTSGSPTPSLTTLPIAAPAESETDNEQT